MLQDRETSSLPMGKGCLMAFKVNDSMPADSLDHHWTEVSYDGAEDSWVPSIPAHWHKHHDEWMQVLHGQVLFTLDGVTTTLTPDSPPFHIPRLHTHSFTFVKGVATVLKERTVPTGDFKEKFFRILLMEGSGDGRPTVWSVGKACWEGDTFLAVPGGLGRGVDEWVTWFLWIVVKWWEGDSNSTPSLKTS